MTALRPLDLAALDLERRTWLSQGAKDTAVRELGLSPTQHAQLVRTLTDSPAALLHDPQLVRRLQRLRDRRRQSRGW